MPTGNRAASTTRWAIVSTEQGIWLEHEVFSPREPLRRSVGRFVGWRFDTPNAPTTTAVPSRYITVILSLDGAIELVKMPTSAQHPTTFSALVGGLHSSPAMVRSSGPAIRLEISPLASRQLLDLPAGALGTVVIDLADLFGSASALLVERLCEERSWVQRFELVEQFLVARLRDRRDVAPEVTRAWELLTRSGGKCRVDALAAEVGWSRRHLAARFAEEIGLSPKQAARVLRFEQACALLQRGRFTFAEAAAEAGFADQAHLNREWQQLAGSTPTDWLAQEVPDPAPDVEFPFVQDTAATADSR
jgi:AraC-like DNA-binding protein